MTIAEQNQKYIDDMALTMQLINQRPGRMIQLASLLNRYASKPKYFGDDDYITLIEMGILVYIASFPGVTNATLCEQFGRTKGAISQLIRKLEDRGYIQREPKPEDAKSFLFYPSLKGMHLIQKINETDQKDTNGTLIRLLQICPLEDIQTFFRMVDIYITILISQISEENQAASAAVKPETISDADSIE